MNAQQRELLRQAVLTVLEANNTRFGLGVDAIAFHAKGYGFPALDRATLEPELEYLQEKELIAEVTKTLSPENRVWKITAAGRDFLATSGV